MTYTYIETLAELHAELAGKRVYLSGPIARCRNYRTRFSTAEYCARLAATHVVNPASSALETEGKQPPWHRRAHMLTDIVMLSQCDTLLLLDGWRESSGAQAEFAFAKASGDYAIFELRFPDISDPDWEEEPTTKGGVQ